MLSGEVKTGGVGKLRGTEGQGTGVSGVLVGQVRRGKVGEVRESE